MRAFERGKSWTNGDIDPVPSLKHPGRGWHINAILWHVCALEMVSTVDSQFELTVDGFTRKAPVRKNAAVATLYRFAARADMTLPRSVVRKVVICWMADSFSSAALSA